MSQATSASAAILTVDGDTDSRKTIRAILQPDGFTIHEAADPDAAVRLLNTVSPDLVLLDLNLTGKNGLELALEIRERLPRVPVIIITHDRDMRVVVQAIRRGIYDYLTKPVNANDLRLSVSQALEEKRLKEEVRDLKGRLEGRTSLLDRMGSSDKIQTMVRLLEKIAPSPFTVLIEGESGAGKELVARAVHDLSGVRDGPFVPVDCGAIPETLFESELFGYVKGAFTGAAGNKTGFFEAANKGTLFLDEVCNLSYSSQQKLLRVMEERRVQRLGSTASKAVDVRVIAATNRPLEEDVAARLFRVDLLYRLKEVSVRVPPLRERPEDIYYLAQRFLDEFRGQLDIGCNGFSSPALTALLQYPWPGNVRELRNIVRQAALTCEEGQSIQPWQLPFLDGQPLQSPLPAMPSLRQDQAGTTVPMPDAATGHVPASAAEAEQPRTEKHGSGPEPSLPQYGPVVSGPAEKPGIGDRSLAEFVQEQTRQLEAEAIRGALRQTGGNKLQAARLLRIDNKTLHRKLKQLGIAT